MSIYNCIKLAWKIIPQDKSPIFYYSILVQEDKMDIFLYQARTEMGLSLRELEKRTGMSRNRINKIENGKSSPKLEELEWICEALGVYMEDLYCSKKGKNLYYSKFYKQNK